MKQLHMADLSSLYKSAAEPVGKEIQYRLSRIATGGNGAENSFHHSVAVIIMAISGAGYYHYHQTIVCICVKYDLAKYHKLSCWIEVLLKRKSKLARRGRVIKWQARTDKKREQRK